MRRVAASAEDDPGHPVAVCIIVENTPSPGDRRVWQEARALTAAGYRVSIICPKGPGAGESFVMQEGIEIFRYAHREGSGLLGHLGEYVWALLAEFWLALRVYRRTRFRVLQACNPPDNIFLIALFFRLVCGTRFIFDHHDPCPELYEAIFEQRGWVYRILRLCESLTFRAADAVMATNETAAQHALDSGKLGANQVFIVRSCPDLSRFQLPAPNPALKEGRQHLVVYLGFMGPQDGLDLLLESIDHIVHQQGRRDITFALIGFGSESERLQRRASELGLSSQVRFTGPVYGDALLAYLATADVGVAPDPVNPLNDRLSMLKIFEYMASGIPIVLYALTEGRRIAEDAALYARANDPVDFARQVTRLLDSEDLRHQLGAAGKQRAQTQLNWNTEKLTLVNAYRAALGTARQPADDLTGVASQKA